MSLVNEIVKDVYKPQLAMVVYKSSESRSIYIEQHKISEKGQMLAGSPLKINTMAKLVKTIGMTNDNIDTSYRGVIPSNLLYCDSRMGNDTIVWWTKPHKQYMFFTEKTGVPNGEMFIPGLVFKAHAEHLYCFAFKGAMPKSKLYAAPFMNVSCSNGSVCLGGSKMSKNFDRTFDNVINYWQQMFWRSEFSHILGSNPCKGNLALITKDCIENNKPFPSDALLESKVTIKDLLK